MEEDIIRYNYACLNSECVEDKNFIVKKLESEEDNSEYCPTCDKELKLMGIITFGMFGGGFKSLSNDGKKAMLRKRANKYAKSNIRNAKD